MGGSSRQRGVGHVAFRTRDRGTHRSEYRSHIRGWQRAVLEAIYGAYAIDWLDQHERIRESIADEARRLAASLLDTEPEARCV